MQLSNLKTRNASISKYVLRIYETSLRRGNGAQTSFQIAPTSNILHPARAIIGAPNNYDENLQKTESMKMYKALKDKNARNNAKSAINNYPTEKESNKRNS